MIRVVLFSFTIGLTTGFCLFLVTDSETTWQTLLPSFPL